MKPFSEACERNREPILHVIEHWFIAPGDALEIGSGTGQHAVYFAAALPHLAWTATDRQENLDGIRQWIDEAALPNLRGPLPLNVSDELWPVVVAQYAFSANTAHIMSWPEVESMFSGVARTLQKGGVFCLYGPFHRDGRYTSESNRVFDESLKTRDPGMGVRNDRDLIDLASGRGLAFIADHPMPASNRLLVWKKE